MTTGIYVAMAVMLVSGTCNTILMKHQTNQMVPEHAGGKAEPFDHPYIQTFFMMVGELGCLAIFYGCTKAGAASLKKGEGFFSNFRQKSLFILPVLCDMTATTLVNMAFLKIPASVVQMTRGMIVFFTCLFSVIFLGRQQYRYHLVGVFLVCAGITLVGYSQLSGVENVALQHAIVLGITLCVVAQAFQASMLVVEEKVLHDFKVEPMLAVGLEGFFGVLILAVVIPYMCVLAPPQANGEPQESVSGALHQMSLSIPLTVSVIASIFSIAFFNWSGITVTKEASAVARSTIDCSRTICVWACELAFGWGKFNTWQLAGFVLLASGTMLYNRILPVPAILEAPEGVEKKHDVEHELPISTDELEQAPLTASALYNASLDTGSNGMLLSKVATGKLEAKPSVATNADGGNSDYSYGTLIHFDDDRDTTSDGGSETSSLRTSRMSLDAMP